MITYVCLIVGVLLLWQTATYDLIPKHWRIIAFVIAVCNVCFALEGISKLFL